MGSSLEPKNNKKLENDIDLGGMERSHDDYQPLPLKTEPRIVNQQNTDNVATKIRSSLDKTDHQA